MREFDATLFTIATGKYLDYFSLQIEQICAHYAPGKTVQVIVATDRTGNLPASKNARVHIEYVKSPSYNWPEITLLRYEQILKHRSMIAGKTLMWLDTDMEFLRTVPYELILGKGDAPYLSRQPGFVWSKEKASWLNPLALAKQLLPWISAWSKFQAGAGTWENRHTSLAYVPAFKRRHYVHGAVWGGETTVVLDMVETLARRTRLDYENGLVALWHDESHLNWYAANKPVRYYPNGFSSWGAAWQFDQNEAYLNSLDKHQLDESLLAQRERIEG